MADDKKQKAISYLLDQGYSPDEVAKMIKDAEADVQKKNPETASQTESVQPKSKVQLPDGYEEPDWFTESGLTYKEDKKVRASAINRVVNTGMFPLPGETKIQALPSDVDDSDKLTPEMVSDIDAYAKNQDTEYVSKNLATFRNELKAKHNITGSKVTNRNIDILLEESLAPKIAKQLEGAIAILSKSGKTKRDLILADGKEIKNLKDQFRAQGWSGDIVDQAFYKALYENSDSYLYEDHINNVSKTAKDVALKTGRSVEDVSSEFEIEMEKDRNDYAVSLFGKEEIKRMQLVQRLEYLKKSPETNISKIAETEAQIKELQKRLQLESHMDWAGSIVNTLVDPLKRPNIANRYTYGAYDENGNKIIHGKMSDEDKERQSEVTAEMDKIKELPNFKSSITTQAKRQYAIIKNLELAEKNLKDETKAKLDTVIVDKGMMVSTMALAANPSNSEVFKITEEGTAKLNRIKELRHNADIKFEALSRMELLNEDVAMMDKTLGYYLGEAGKTIVNKNNLNLFKDITSEAEQLEATRELYDNMGIAMDEEELKNTAPDIYLDIARSGAELTDFAVKMIALDKAMGVKGMLAFTNKLRKTGAVEKMAADFLGKSATRLEAAQASLGVRGTKAVEAIENLGLSALEAAKGAKASKVAANAIEAGIEGAKFEIVSNAGESNVSGFETGVAFYEVGKLMPNLRVANKFINVIANGIIRSSAAMTASMEVVAGYETARNAIANDKDFERAMEDNGIIGWADKDEVFRRVMVEMVTAVPFGLRSMTSMREAGYSNTTVAEIRQVAKQLREMGKVEEAIQLEMATVSGISEQGSKIAFKIKDQMTYLREQGRYDPSKKLEQNMEEYKLMVEEMGYDPITNQMLEAHNGKVFGVSIINDVITLQEKIEYLKKRQIDLTHNSSADIERKFEEQKQIDIDADALLESKIITNVIKTERRAPRYKTKEQDDLSKIKLKVLETKKEDVDWDAFSKEEGTKVRSVFSRLRDRVGEGNFIKYLNEAIGMTRVSEGGKGKLFELIPAEGFSSKEVFDAFVDTMQSMRSDNRKSDAIDRVELLQDVLNRIESLHKPEAGYVEMISKRPSMDNMITLPEMTLLKEQIKSYKRGSTEGKQELVAKLKEVQAFIQGNADIILDSLKDTKITKGELNVLTNPLKANAVDADVIDRASKILQVVHRMESRAIKKRIVSKIAKAQPRTTKGGEIKQGTVDFITSTKLNVVETLLNANTDSAVKTIARLELLKKDAVALGNKYEADVYKAQINALRTTGSRDMAIERISELTDKGIENMTRSELLELELLEFNDMKRMTRVDLINAERNLDLMNRYGMSVREVQEMNNNIYIEAERRAGLEALGFTKEEIESGRASKVYTSKGVAGDKTLSKSTLDALRRFRENQESFYTLMEYVMRDTPGREHMEGYFHSITHDIYRARQEKESNTRKMKSIVSANKARIFGVDSKQLSKISDSHAKEHNISLTVNGRKSDIKGATKSGKMIERKMTVNQAYKLWQSTLMESNKNAFLKMGLGVVEVDGKLVFDAELLRSELESFISAKSPVGSKVIDYARWQVEELFPMFYPRLNEAHRQRNGIDMQYETNYSPSIRMMEGESMGNVTKSILEGNSNFFIQSMLPGFLKVKQRNPFVEINTEIDGDVFLNKYIDKVEHFMAFQPVVDRMDRVFGDKNIKAALAVKNSPEINEVISGFIERIKNDSTQTGTTLIDKTFDFFRRNIVRSKLGLNISLFPKQLVALPAYMHSLEPGEMTNFAGHLIPTKDMVQALRELNRSDFVINRVTSGSHERDFKDVITKLETRIADIEVKGKGGIARTWTGDFAQDMLISTKLGDIATVLWGGQAVYRIKRDKYIKEGFSVAEAKKKAYEDFVISSSLTQASGNAEDLSAIQSMGSVGKMLTLFQNTPLQYVRVEVAAITNMMKAKRRMRDMDSNDPNMAIEKKRYANGVKDVLIYHFLLPMMFQSAIKRFYLGDDEMMDDPDMMISMGLGTASYVFMMGQVVKAISEYAASGRTFGVQVGGIIEGVSKDFNKAIESMDEILSDDPITERDVFERMIPTAKPLLSTIGNFTGVPLVPATNLLKGSYDFLSGNSSDLGDLVGYSSQGTGSGDRSPDYRLMNKYLERGDDVSKFLSGVKDQFSKEDWTRNKERLRREYKMYDHFGGYDPIVNHLFRSRLSNTEKAEYLYRMKSGKLNVPVTVGTIVNAIKMDDAKWNSLVDDLKRYGVISDEVTKEIKKLERDSKKADK